MRKLSSLHLVPFIQTGPKGRRGQGGSPCSLGPWRHWFLPVPSPEAGEAAASSWMGQMAGDRLGGTGRHCQVVEGGPRAPCQVTQLSVTAVLTTWAPGAASAIGRLRSECWRRGAVPQLPGIQPRGGAWQDQALGAV